MFSVSLHRIATLGASALVFATHLQAATQQYTLALPANQSIQYRIDLHVAHPGRLVVEADWNTPRVLSLRLDRGDGSGVPARRSGPSPLRLDVLVHAADLASGRPWSLWIRGLPTRHSALGHLTVQLPEAEPARALEPPPRPEPAGPPPEPWRLPSAMPPGAAEPRVRFHEAVERFRATVVDPPSKEPDDYRWQYELLSFLAVRRDAPAGTIPPLSEATRSWLRRVESAARDVSHLRDSADPIVAGPVPEEPDRARAWQILHRQRVQPLERDLDALLHEFERGHTPELTAQTWIARLLSCLTVCQRHFDERARLGPDQASFGDVVQRQWVALQAGAEALGRLAALDPSLPLPDSD